jgi:hypothetical protein
VLGLARSNADARSLAAAGAGRHNFAALLLNNGKVLAVGVITHTSGYDPVSNFCAHLTTETVLGHIVACQSASSTRRRRAV